MDKNVGGIDRTGRIVIGVVVAIAGIAALTGYWGAGAVIGGIALLIGAILLVTGTTQKCPINETVGIDTTDRGELMWRLYLFSKSTARGHAVKPVPTANGLAERNSK